MKAAIYCRLSEEDRNKPTTADDSESIRNQRSLLTQYALEKNWEIYDIYSDDDYTGADRKRPAFQRLLADAESRRFDLVLCKTQSRFTRELEIVEKYLHGLFPAWGIRFISIADNADTAVQGNKKARQINGLINEWYLEDLSENIKSVLTNKRQNGQHIGSFALYGYRRDPERKGHLLVDDEAAAIVREVFTLFAQGYGKTAIARMLNDRGVPNPTEYRRLKNQCPPAQKPTLWKYFAIADMLVNEIYIGNMVQGKYGSISYKTKANRPRPREQWIVVENTHVAIIDRALWDTVQSLIHQRNKPFAAGRIGAFAKKAVCMHCGYTMRSSKSHGRHYLKCGTRHVAHDACAGAFIAVETLEKAVLRELRELNGTCLNAERLASRVCFAKSGAERQTKALAELALCERRIAEYAKAIRDAYMDKTTGTITESQFLDFTAEFTREKERLEKQAQAVEEGFTATVSTDNPEGRFAAYLSLTKLDRLTVETMIDRISVGHKTPDGQVPVAIHWNF